MPTIKKARERLDRRVVRTRRAIMEAFSKLLAEKEIGKITVSAIAREADIDRKTFYLHYTSVDDLVEQVTRGYADQVINALRERGKGKSTAECVHIALAEINDIVEQNIEMFTHVASSISTDQVLARFAHAMETDPSVDDVRALEEIEPNMRMRLQFYAAGALSLYSTWLQSDHAAPIETISNTIEEAITSNIFPDLATA